MSLPGTVAVAGGTGFIGRHVVQALREAGVSVVVLARRAEDIAGVQTRAADVGASPPDLRGIDAVVNLVGIKAPSGDNTWQRAHVDAVTHLVQGMTTAGIRRLVHVSVVALPETLSDYAATKAAGERVASQSDRDVTILRPALVVGPGDDATTNLVRTVRQAPVFPVAAGPGGPLSPVDVRDVAAAVVEALRRPETIGKTIDVVGPEATDLATLVRRVADALSLRTLVLPVPAVVLRTAASVMERLPGDPLITRSQLAMLQHGLSGDPEAAKRELGLTPRGLDRARIVELAETIEDVLPSVRIAPTAAHREFLASRRPAIRALRWFVPAALLSMLLLPFVLSNVWLRMASVEAALAAAAILGIAALRWRETLALRPSTVGMGLLAAGLWYAVCWLGFSAIGTLWPPLAAEVAVMYAWPDTLALAIQLPLLALTVAGEDVVWRTAIGVPLSAAAGPVVGALASGALFALAHVTSGPPLLWLAALICGAFWTALLVRTRSLAATITCHLAWDVLVIYVAPY